MGRKDDFNFAGDVASETPSRTSGRRQDGSGVASYVALWGTIFTSVLLANLLTLAITYVVVRAYVNHKIGEANDAIKRGK